MKAILCLLLLVSCTKNKGKSRIISEIRDEVSQERNSTPTTETPGTGQPVPDTNPEPSPETTLPDCKRFCSTEKNIFKRGDTGFNYLSFKNFGYRGIGRCRGHALVTQKLNMLAKFDSSRPQCDLSTFDCQGLIRTKIRAIMSFQSQTIKGFSNVYEFSSHPVVSRILKSYVRGTSHRYSAVSVDIPQDPKKTLDVNTFVELQKRIRRGHIPYIGVYGIITGAHALLGYKLKYSGARELICVKDPNMASGHREACENYLYHSNGLVYYKRADRVADKLSVFSLSNDENRRITRYRSALRPVCMRESRLDRVCK